jgi:hypothetical protein
MVHGESVFINMTTYRSVDQESAKKWQKSQKADLKNNFSRSPFDIASN